MSRRHPPRLNAHSSPATNLAAIAGRSSRLPARKSEIVVVLTPLARASSPLRDPAEQFHSKPKTVRGHARRSHAVGCLRKRLRGSDGQAPPLSGHAVRRGCAGGGSPAEGRSRGDAPRRRGLRDTGAGERKAGGPRGG